MILLIFLTLLASCHGEFFDEMLSYDPECLMEGAFPCISGGCISQDKYCDGIHDCHDGSDENFCYNVTPDAPYCNETHQFMCGDNRKCIPNTWICNNETDCDDGSDEINCTVPVEHVNSTCKGFLCDGGKHCISNFWICDGYYDCDDKTDEDIKGACHENHNTYLTRWCKNGRFSCADDSYCLSLENMCDGIRDCRDGSDEGNICKTWHTMCANFTCDSATNGTCEPRFSGPTCVCNYPFVFNTTSKRCENQDHCITEPMPLCSHSCKSLEVTFKCSCDYGYKLNFYGYLCFAPDPEPMLFYSTKNDIRYITVRSKKEVIVATGIKQAHGVSYDGNHLYWVETAQGHQAIMRAELGNVAESKQVLAALGLEEPGDIAFDHLGDNIYFSDAERGIINVCKKDGSLCTTLKADTKIPRYVTLDHKTGTMYWSDWRNRPVIMTSRMDGSNSSILIDNLTSFATGLALDAPNDRLYFVDRTIKVIRLQDKRVYLLFQEPFHHPYSISVFENTVFWSDWTTNTIQTTDKLHGTHESRTILLKLEMPVFDMHIYHPVLMYKTHNPCDHQLCAICLITSNETYSCACPDTMSMIGNQCQEISVYRSEYIIVGGGSTFTRVHYNAIGNPETHGTNLDIGRVQAMAYDNTRDTLYIYDSQRKSINYINMSEFTLGITHILMYRGLDNVVDMDYDYVSDNLYILEAGRRLIEVVSLKTKYNAIIYYFDPEETPISFCLLPEYGRMLVAILESDDNNAIHIDSIRLDGTDRKHVQMNNIIGPNIRIRYSPEMNVVYLADEGSGVIDMMHPEGTGREEFRYVLTTIASVAVTDTHLFWTDRHSSRLYWADVHDATYKTRRIELSIFSNDTILHIISTSSPSHFLTPICPSTCSHICIQNSMNHTCLCPPGYKMENGICTEIIRCKEYELYCHKSNECSKSNKKCDGVRDCKYGEDEEGCDAPVTQSPTLCKSDQTNCHGTCISKNVICKANTSIVSPVICDETEYKCQDQTLCIPRSLSCDGRADCPDGSDESPAACDTRTCFTTEFMCGSGNCIPITWHCDGSEDCADGSDEINCYDSGLQCPEYKFRCRNSCIDLSKRCDGKNDCEDQEDEENCETSEFIEMNENVITCMPWEHPCKYNTSICILETARCNGKTDCPGTTDEEECVTMCTHPPGVFFNCKHEFICINNRKVCDGHKDCATGYDETPEACAKVNKTLPTQHNSTSCSKGYRCDSGQCVEWTSVCDRHPDCGDSSDENGHCGTECPRDMCTHECRPTPRGPQCMCPHGYIQRENTCADVDECAQSACAHACHNLPGSFFCSCHRGYQLRSDRRSCKALRGRLSILYYKGKSVWSMTSHVHSFTYHDQYDREISDLDIDVRREKMYIAFSDSGSLVEINLSEKNFADELMTNVGVPGKVCHVSTITPLNMTKEQVSVDWVTGNVYFWDRRGLIRVCHFKKRRCAKLLRLPSSATVTSLVVDPANHKLFYCVSEIGEAIVRSASLSGRSVSDLGSVVKCSGLAADSFSKVLYITSEPSTIYQVDYEGQRMSTFITNNPHTHSPHSLALFEDYLYFISGSQLIRCLTFSSKACSTYTHLANATKFVIQHESVQRDDIRNECEKIVCPNVCVLEPTGPQCICHDGALSSDGNCPAVKTNELPLFDGAITREAETRVLPIFLVSLLLLLFVLYVSLFVHRILTKENAADYIQVRYHNTVDGVTHVTNPIIDVPEAGYVINGMGHEFINPLQFVRNIWQDSLKKSKPITTSGLPFETQDLSDTESDLDVRENRRVLN